MGNLLIVLGVELRSDASVINPWSLVTYLLIFLLSFVGPFFWPLNNEVVLVAALATGKVDPFLTAALISVGSTAAFMVWYALGRFARSIHPKWRRQMDRIPLQKFERYTSIVLFVSGAIAFPPVTAVALLSGSLRLSPLKFFVFELMGRATRFFVLTRIMDLMIPYFQSHHYHESLLRWLTD
ncbi:MAG TPA: VTT domain-containing protein [Bdellovibrionota bacterium]|nr:VTT domain-containing protein [Bdellovibrionota bacterium]